jgi:hypothetical protein
MRRVWLRAAALALAAGGVIAGLTVYFSTADTPPCFVSGLDEWRGPTAQVHHLAVVFPDEAACFITVGSNPRLVAQLALPGVKNVSAAVPNGSDVALRTPSGTYTLDLRNGHMTTGGLAPFDSRYLTQVDPEHQVIYVTQRGRLGFRVIDMRTGTNRFVVGFKGFSWNPDFGPNPPSHGLALRPDRPELWVLDAPNHTLHAFDVSALPEQPPRRLADVRLDRTMTDAGSLTRSADGRYLYVGGTGDVIDTQKREPIAQFDALQHATAMLEVEWENGQPVYPGFPR